jgi:SAM-dependent methyltransferase
MTESDLHYYSHHASSYHKDTFHIDPTSFLEPLTRFVKPPAKILDVGCASGRDLLWLKQRGYSVLGLEGSAALAEMARRNAGCRVIEADFQYFDFTTLQVDALIVIGALVHLKRDEFISALQGISQSVKQSGFLLLSVKSGSGFYTGEDGRTFYAWEHEEIGRLFDHLGLKVMNYAQSTSLLSTGEKWLAYVLQKLSHSDDDVELPL